jgi:biotin transporter BioY
MPVNDTFLGRLLDELTTSGIVLTIPIVALVLANRAFQLLAPADFNQVSILRRAGVVGGALMGAGAALAPVLAGKGLGLAMLAGATGGGVMLFGDLLGSRLIWLLPPQLWQAPVPALVLVLAGLATWAVPIISAVAYWSGRERLKALMIAIGIVPFMALSLVYATTLVVWFVHFLNIWSIAVAGLVYQRYRNSQLHHG